MITLVAIKKDDVVYIGKPGERHSDILTFMLDNNIYLDDIIQGFVDDHNKFYNRHDAAIHAFECGQLKDDKVCPDIILSEDLW